MKVLFFILIAFEIKHFFCDYIQTDWMASGKGRRHGWFFPLLAHALWHGFWTGAIMAAWSKSLEIGLICGALDTAAHLTIDRIKSSPNMLGNYKSDERWFWIILGADQAAHHFCYLGIVFGFYFWR